MAKLFTREELVRLTAEAVEKGGKSRSEIAEMIGASRQAVTNALNEPDRTQYDAIRVKIFNALSRKQIDPEPVKCFRMA